MKSIHKSVLLKETIDGLELVEGDVVLDATLGGAGYTKEMLARMKDKIVIVGIDADEDAVLRAKEEIEKKHGNAVFVLENFRHLDKALPSVGILSVSKAVFDLGLSSDELELSGRGFSFKREEPLLMTLSKNPDKHALTAYDVVNSFERENLEAIIRGYGEEKFAGRITRAIVEAREIEPIKTTTVLAEVIKKAVPRFYRIGKIHPATKTFQAIRITVNDELTALHEALEKAFVYLRPGGRLAVVSFHSLEDRIVKDYFRNLKNEGKASLVNKKPIVPTQSEIKENPRSRSAKLRIIEKI